MKIKKNHSLYVVLILMTLILFIFRIQEEKRENQIISLINKAVEIDSAEMIWLKEQQTIPLPENEVKKVKDFFLLSHSDAKKVKKHLRKKKEELFQVICYKGEEKILTLHAMNIDSIADEVKYMELDGYQFVLAYHHILLTTENFENR